ncbi:MAG TPA: YbaK/EbsC family protein [Anaerolinea sp.]|nr:YbaK/EbsC family protein [Anaerolinea sp.]
MDEIQSAVIDFLKQSGAEFNLFVHPGPVLSIEQAARERGQQTSQVVRSILFRLPDDQFLMVLVAGPRQVNWPLLRKYLNSNRVTLATPEEVLRVTGYRIGTVSPFGLPVKMRLLVDRRLTDQEVVSFGSGLPGVAIIIQTAEALKLIHPYEWITV